MTTAAIVDISFATLPEGDSVFEDTEDDPIQPQLSRLEFYKSGAFGSKLGGSYLTPGLRSAAKSSDEESCANASTAASEMEALGTLPVLSAGFLGKAIGSPSLAPVIAKAPPLSGGYALSRRGRERPPTPQQSPRSLTSSGGATSSLRRLEKAPPVTCVRKPPVPPVPPAQAERTFYLRETEAQPSASRRSPGVTTLDPNAAEWRPGLKWCPVAETIQEGSEAKDANGECPWEFAAMAMQASDTTSAGASSDPNGNGVQGRSIDLQSLFGKASGSGYTGSSGSSYAGASSDARQAGTDETTEKETLLWQHHSAHGDDESAKMDYSQWWYSSGWYASSNGGQ
eukprot:TRINITY_DN52146_c0_g1_i1.p1 TRINITY_DN52146_c0_g1~~TRINITY_DN52146_c0_g1_i1.p1  ORF type:complete len:341 (+),score=65.45 TRINITY_DN52146_c0_g1_i1:143-1165(+)